MFALSVKKVKALLEIEDTEKDKYLEEMLPVAISFVEEYCNNSFAVRDEEGELVKDSGSYQMTKEGIILPLVKLIEYFMHEAGVTQSTISRISKSVSDNIPASIRTSLNSYRVVNFL